MRIAPMKSKKKSRNWKKLLPIVLTVLMVGSGLVAFTYSQPSVEYMRLSVVTWNEFSGGFEAVYSNQFDYVENTTALNLLRMTGMNVDYVNGTIECISAYCNFERTWEFYVNNEMKPFPAEFYIVQKNDEIVFAYE